MSHARKIAASFLATIFVVALLPASGSAATAPREFYGIASLDLPTTSQWDQLGRAHAGTYRLIMSWNNVEQTPGARNWAPYDAVFSDAARNGIRVMPMLYGSPPFVAKALTTPPTTAAGKAAFLKFVAEVVGRYGNGGTFWRDHPEVPPIPVTNWQLWNEVNTPGFWLPHPTPKQYASLLKPTARAIRAADPSAKVILSGLFPTAYIAHSIAGPKWLKRFYKIKKITKFFDAVAVHPYANVPRQALTTIRQTRKIMKDAHDKKTPIWVTELGWATQGTPTGFTTTQAGQASNLTQAFQLLAANRGRYRIRGVVWYALDDVPGSSNWAYNSGLFDVNGAPKPAWPAYAAVAGGTP